MTRTEDRLDRIEAMLEALISTQAPAVPASVEPVLADTPTADTPKGKALCRSTRKAFVRAAKREGNDFAKVSTQAIAAMCVEDPTLVPAGFRIGTRYAEKFSA